jgi:hypothetical protein
MPARSSCAGIAPSLAPTKLEDLNDRVREEVRRIDRFVQLLVDEKLALPFFTLQEILQSPRTRSAANAMIVAAKGKRRRAGSFEARRPPPD